MSPYFYSLGMIITGRYRDVPNLTMMDLLAEAIADDEHEPAKLLAFLFRPTDRTVKP